MENQALKNKFLSLQKKKKKQKTEALDLGRTYNSTHGVKYWGEEAGILVIGSDGEKLK